MQQLVNKSRSLINLAKEIKRKGQGVWLLILVPCVPAVVACATAAFPLRSAAADAQVPAWSVGKGAPPPLLLRPLSAGDAVALNRHIPFSAEPNPAAQPLVLSTKGNARARAMECLTSAIYYEAASEALDGQRAVAQVILNRARHPAFPASVCAVIYQGSTLRTGCQFSFTCDGSLQRIPSRLEWDRARAVADSALSGSVYAPVGLATHYHTQQVVPYWAPSLAKNVQIGAHIFYRWAGGAGRPDGFTQHYSGTEGDPLALRAIALLSHDIWPADDASVAPRLAVAIDPEVELNGIVRILATAPGPQEGAYEKAIRAHFGGDPVQPLFRALDRGPASEIEQVEIPAISLAAQPKTLDDQLLSAAAAVKNVDLNDLIRDFGREMRLAIFLRAHRAELKEASKQAQQLAERTALDWEIYSGTPVPARKAILSLSQGLGDASCMSLALPKSTEHVLNWPSDIRDLSPADIFIGSGFVDDSLAVAAPGARRKVNRLRVAVGPVQDQIVAAVFARVAALSRGEPTANAIIAREVARGHSLVPLLAQRLRFFEQHRGEYSTLDQFLPRLIAGLTPAKARTDVGDAAVIPAACQTAAKV